MGIFDFLTGGRKPPPGGIRGAAQVISATRHTGRGVYQNCRLNLVIQAPGIAPFAAEFHGLVHHRRWPSPGAVLPVAVDPHNPRAFAILWDEVPDSGSHARQTAESIAAAMRAGAPPGAGPQVQFIGDPAHLTEEQRAKLRALGIEPPAAPAAGPPPVPQQDPISQLERLAALRAQGVLTDAEFAEQKRRILGG